MEKNYTSLFSHSAIYFRINFAFIDNFKIPDYMTVTLSGTSIPGGSSLKTYNSYLTSDICGGSDPDTTQFTIMGSIPHSADLLEFKIAAKAATGAGSGTIGIRDINLFFVNDSSVTSTSSCFRVYDTQLTGLSGECQCKKGYYYHSGTCSVCDPSCGDCFGPSSSQCFSCVSGFSFNGTNCIQCDSSCLSCSGSSNNQCLICQAGYWLQKNGTCTLTCGLPASASQVVGVLQVCETICQDSEYLLWDGSCVTSCPSPLVASTVDANLLCNKPCQAGEFFDYKGNCVSGCSSPYVQGIDNAVDTCNLPCDPVLEYLYPNTSCSTSCDFPLISSFQMDIQWCNSPCGSDFLYPNNSCNPQCDNPLIASSVAGITYCNSPCGTNGFIYPDNSCNPQCNNPLLVSSVMGIQYCNSPCGTNEFIYPNGSCESQCGSPLVSTTYNTINWCSSPCSYYLDYYYPNNGTCQPSCPPSGTIKNYDLVSVCFPPAPTSASTLTTEEKNAVDQASSVTNGAGATARATTAASSIVSSGSPNAISLISFMKMLDYIRYMKINYPPKLEYFLDSKGEGSLSLSFQVSLPEKIKEEFPNYPLPGKFGEYVQESSFIVNYWEELLTCAIILMILAFATALAIYAQKIKYIGSFFVKVKSVIQWNLMLIVICSNMDSVGVYSSLEIRTTPFNSFLSVLGTLICVVFNLVAIFLMGFTLYITYSLWRARKRVLPVLSKGFVQQKPKKETEEKYLNCGVLYLNFRNGSLLQRSCMFFILLRIYLFNMVIGYLFNHPLAQAILIVLMSFMMLAFLSIQRPYRKTFELIKAITYESILFVVNICILVLAIMDHRGLYMKEERVRLGDVIILTNTLFNVVAVVFIGIEIVLRSIKAYKISKQIKNRGLAFWIKMLVTLFEPQDLEDVAEERSKMELERKQTIQIKSLFEVGSRNESHLDLEKSSQNHLKNTVKVSLTPTGLSSLEPANSILSFEGLIDNSSRKNLLLSPQNTRKGGSIFQNFPSGQSLEINRTSQKRTISRLNLNRFSVLNQTQMSFQEVPEADLGKMASNETPTSRTFENSPPKEEKVSRKLSENLFLLGNMGSPRDLKKRRRTGVVSPSHFSHDQLGNSSFESDPNTPTQQIHSAGFCSESVKLSMCSNFKPRNRDKRNSP